MCTLNQYSNSHSKLKDHAAFKLAMALLFALLITATTHKASAQSCCCTGAGANYSILPNLDKHVVGLRYSFGSYNTTVFPDQGPHHHTPDMDMGTSVPAVQNMHTLDAFARFNLPKRFQVSVYVPVHLISTHATGTEYTGGLGDMSLLVQYALLDPLKCHGTKNKHQVRLGAGIKVPTGRFKMTDGQMFATDLQLGTGSVDFLFNVIYTYRYKQFGINLMAAYKKNLVNRQQFRFGDRMKYGATALYIFKLPKEVSIMPTAGASYNYTFSHVDVGQKEKLTYTGGSFLSADLGFDIYYKKVAISTTVSPVLLSVSNWNYAAYPILFFETGVYFNFATDSKGRRSSNKEEPKAL